MFAREQAGSGDGASGAKVRLDPGSLMVPID